MPHIVKCAKNSKYIEVQIAPTAEAAVARLWDEDEGFFVSGSDNQISWASLHANVFYSEVSALVEQHQTEKDRFAAGHKLPGAKRSLLYLYGMVTVDCWPLALLALTRSEDAPLPIALHTLIVMVPLFMFAKEPAAEVGPPPCV